MSLFIDIARQWRTFELSLRLFQVAEAKAKPKAKFKMKAKAKPKAKARAEDLP